jgi:hypothetical protein
VVPHRRKAVAFDVDSDSLIALRQAFPGWEVETKGGATPASLARNGTRGPLTCWSSSPASVRGQLGLCRGLRGQASRPVVKLLVGQSGALTVDRGEGQGSTFVVALPRYDADDYLP